jgi:hypothetical protein
MVNWQILAVLWAGLSKGTAVSLLIEAKISASSPLCSTGLWD